ncbi:MAG TPA: class II D-tagatose-bisphosphate aldolase, non-catalytic subunit [Clostridiales bacterium]|jgi:D-tagatose-1,6-bisphosphate aldolase subunit GatZ/KbaZ|nr:class II D-tagatose-bisphosphate aldolase, non-catalytic subunit [Clostridiales bacterium]
MHPIKTLLESRRHGKKTGIYSACTASPEVIFAVCEAAKESNTLALVEATANQVNQFGGYTGMRPADYAAFVKEIAKEAGLPLDRLVLGGDHLGPLTWQNLPEVEAMANARELIAQYVAAGFTKIHIDTSMRLADDDKNARLSDAVIARRGAELAAVAEAAFVKLTEQNPNAVHPIYCIGSEVPIPGGAQEHEGISVTSPADFKASVQAFYDAFEAAGVLSAWPYVTGVVVQPGVEFGDDNVDEYNREAAKELTKALAEFPSMVFEGHSTDYQTKYKLKELVEDGVAILKVGPGLTFALREGYFALEHIEQALLPQYPALTPSCYAETLDRVMVEDPGNWAKYYHGTKAEQDFKRKYSFSDRCRYYFPQEEVKKAAERLLSNLEAMRIPLSLLSQYMPIQYIRVREGKLPLTPRALLLDRVKHCIEDYLFAVTD